MSKKTIIFFIVISIVLGYIVGKLDFISPKTVKHVHTYTPQVPENIAGDSTAFSDIVKAVSPSVVNISTTKIIKRDSSPFSHFFDPFNDFFESFRIPKKWKERSLGSGVVVSSDGYIITNNHVIERADEIKVILYDKQEYKGKIIGKDPKTDVAVIKISAKDLPAVKWGDSDGLQVGEFVLAFGNSYGFSHTVTMGIVSAVGRANVGIADYEDFIQTDAAINPGNSGGPLVNIKGELIGINTAIFSRTGGSQGIGFAIPSNMVELVMKQLVKEGKVTRGWLGITIQSVTPELAKEFGLKNGKGALVSDVFSGSPAEKAGIKRGDVILQIKGRTVRDSESLRNIVAQTEAGSRIKLKIIRDNKPVSLTATIAEYPEDLSKASVRQPEQRLEEKNYLAGFTVIDITMEIAKQLGLSRGEKGVVIVKVEPYSAADESGLKKGDVIQELNKKRVTNLRDFNNITSHIKEGDAVLLYVNRGERKFYITFKAYS
ncbi:MAG: DegQ family serine endoprotease [Thermodesulfovibrionia bacterium]|nr:DegQ family serine endoprotease [Thermodesulfovibrionia bacterium]MCK5287264.1 DegQ family serine endoprotease [Thermodesulfovibrionia bacterium]